MVAFDIDGCVNAVKEDIIALGKDFFADKAVYCDPTKYYLREIYPGFSENMYKEFWEKYGYKIYTNPPRKNVYETIDFVRKNSVGGCYITSRTVNKRFNGLTLKEITEEWLNRYNIELPVYYEKDKEKAVYELGVNLMIEDKPENILRIGRFSKVLIYKHPYNQAMQGIFVENWDDILKVLQKLRNAN